MENKIGNGGSIIAGRRIAGCRILERVVVACIAVVGVMTFASCEQGGWTSAEKRIINDSGETMRVLTIDDVNDSIVLRTPCAEIGTEELNSEVYRSLAEKMVATVTSPEQNGVGIAGPQVGILRRVVAVQRFDKEGEPFEVYPNLWIIECRGDKVDGPEGCLSIPGRRGIVPRYRDIDIRYTSTATLKDTVENVTGFTAVIFQHEYDHLYGILYTDYLH